MDGHFEHMDASSGTVAGVLGTASLLGSGGLPAGVADRGGVKPALPVVGGLGVCRYRTSSETPGLTLRRYGVFLPQNCIKISTGLWRKKIVNMNHVA